MQRYSTIFLLIAVLTVAFCAPSLAQSASSNATTDLESGNKAFDAGQFTQAMTLYENVYASGNFSESMLYRLAFMHENLRNYPQAIYYLKKAAQEYGERDSEPKIRQLMQRQGSTRFFSGDTWNGYLTLFRTWAWLIYSVFGVSILGIAAHHLLPNRKRTTSRTLVGVSAWSLMAITAFILFHRSFMVPERAVILETTAFYDAPGFSADHRLNEFSLGETVDIDGQRDIWLQVSAGGKQYWVPNWVVRTL